MDTLVSQLNAQPDPLKLGVPAEGGKCLPIRLDFTAQDSYSLDYTNMQSRGWLAMCQCLFVDNSNSDVAVTITMGRTGQVVIVMGRTQGYYPVLQPNPIQQTYSSPSGGLVTIFLINSFIQGCNWKTA